MNDSGLKAVSQINTGCNRDRAKLATVLLLMLWLIATSAQAKEQIWQVPIFFVTDRQPSINLQEGLQTGGFQSKKTVYGTKRLKEVDTISGLHAGIAEICIPVMAGTKLTDWQKSGVTMKTVAGTQPPKITEFNCHSSADFKDEFDSQLFEALAKCKNKEVFVFVHGFNDSFNDAGETAAELAFYTGCPTILYSWPSAQKVYRYSLDECNNEWSQEHFNQLVEHLYTLKKEKNLKINIVAHSMGNRLFIRALPVFTGSGIFSDIYLVNPDFDAQTFVHYLARCMPKTGVVGGVRGQFLVSRKDKALSLAEGVFGGYTRLGQGSDFTLSALLSPSLFNKVWGEHSNSFKPSAAGADKIPEKDLEALRIASIAKCLRVIDVTSLDHGWIGHKVPIEYIAWTHFNNSPPEGYEVVEEPSQGSNRSARFFAKMCGQKLTKPVGDYLVVRPLNPHGNKLKQSPTAVAKETKVTKDTAVASDEKVKVEVDTELEKQP
ncbi:hypothetical protein BH10CYA1_BH10CYA1_26050 [soil metagenome]